MSAPPSQIAVRLAKASQAARVPRFALDEHAHRWSGRLGPQKDPLGAKIRKMWNELMFTQIEIICFCVVQLL